MEVIIIMSWCIWMFKEWLDFQRNWTVSHTWILKFVVNIWILKLVVILINASARTWTRDLWYHIELHAPTSSTQNLS
jgi:hypothetical protein